jgi:hypothetical protein
MFLKQHSVSIADSKYSQKLYLDSLKKLKHNTTPFSTGKPFSKIKIKIYSLQ